jgi:hypothetical protein
MRNRFLFLGLSVSVFAGAAAFLACSGGTESTPSTDAGMDVADTGPVDTGADVARDSATCDLSADFVTQIPDASIADGASTSGICAGCIEAKCKTDLDKCNHDCTCQNLANAGLTCYLAHSDDPTQCIGPFLSAPTSTRNIALGMFGCVNSSCQDECAVNSFLNDGGDGGDADAD